MCLAVLLILALFTGCKRTDIIDATTNPTTPAGDPINDLTQVIAGVSGIVLDESNAPIATVTVTSGTATTTTNSNGMFIFNGISLSKENGSITVVKTGYFKGVRSFKTLDGKNNTVKIRLMPRGLSGTVNATTGGTITSTGGATIVFPANAFVTSAGAVYTGSVKVYSRWIDPTAANLPDIIPGDLRGITAAGVENILETYGMAGAELEDASGSVLKIAPGKTATINFPIPAALSATAPATITLWHFDDATARWKENGTATKAGSTYIAQVEKFSFWNCDIGSTNYVTLDFTVLNAVNSSPLVSTNIRIKRIADGSYGYGITNNTGFVYGLVPKNEQLILEIISSCGTVIYSQNINPLSVNTSLGKINASLPASQTLTFTGSVLNCSAAPVSNGYVSLYMTGEGGYVATSATGTFSFSLINCSGATLAYNCQAVDNTTAQQSALITGSASIGTINLGNINACGTVGASVYVAGAIGNAAVLWKNGVVTYLTDGSHQAAANSVFVSGTDVYVAGYENSTWGDIAKVWKNGVATKLDGGLYPNGSSYDARGNSVFVSGTDVYVAGSAYNGATIWKNGAATSLAGGSTQNYAEAFSVFVSGTDVYVAGTAEVPFPNNLAAIIWKDGLTTNLTTNGTTSAGANSIFLSGTDVYVAGSEQIQGSYVAKVWKNGVVTILSNAFSDANSVFTSGTDVYVAGRDRVPLGPGSMPDLPTVWKNGVATYLSNVNGEAKSVFVYGTDVYVSGFQSGAANDKATIWKNGLAINLSDGTTNSVANSIYVK